MRYVPKQLEHTADISRGKTKPWEFASDIAKVAAAFFLLYLLLGFVADFAAEHLPSSWEARISWTPSMAETDTGRPRAQAVFEGLLEAAEIRPLPYRLIVIDQEDANAFAFPGGIVVLTSGLLRSVQSEIGLAMVIGHELGHHHRRHVLKSLGRRLLVVTPVLAITGDAATWIDDLLTWGEASYSRDQEREADGVGLQLVFDAYGQTEGALEFFENLMARADDDNRWAQLAASHPPTAERIEALKRQASKLLPRER